MSADDWKKALTATPECLDLDRLGEELDATSRAHVESCARCQSELALFRAITSAETSAEEDRVTKEIAAGLRVAGSGSPELSRPNPISATSGPGANPPETRNPQPATTSQRTTVVEFRPRPMRVLYSVAASLLILIGAGVFMQMREPAVDPIGTGGVYRSARLELLAPAGELVQAPNELRWSPVPNASRYRVRIAEVDGTVVWSTDTNGTFVALPPDAIAQFAPGKSLLWEVKAFRGEEMLAASETQSVRVSVDSRNPR